MQITAPPTPVYKAEYHRGPRFRMPCVFRCCRLKYIVVVKDEDNKSTAVFSWRIVVVLLFRSNIFEKTHFVPLVESGICLLVDVATLSTIYDVRHPLLLPPGYLTQELISRP